MFEKDKEAYYEPLFNRDITHKVVILKLLYNKIDGVNIEQLIAATGLDRRTIYKYINQLNDFSLKVYNKEAIVYSPNNNYRFLGNKLDLQNLKVAIIESTPIYALVKLFLSNKTVNLHTFCVENYIGESTFKRQIRKVNQLLKYVKASISIRKGELVILGDEATIRYCFITFLWRTYRGLDWPFDLIPQEKIDGLVNFISSRTGVSISTGKRQQLAYIFAVNIARANIKLEPIENNIPSYSSILIELSPFYKPFKGYLEENFSLGSSEIKFIFNFLQTFPDFSMARKNNQEFLHSIKGLSHPVYSSISQFINFVRKQHPEFGLETSQGNTFVGLLIASHIFIDTFTNCYFNISDINLTAYAMDKFPHLIPTIYDFICKASPHLELNARKTLAVRYAQAYVMVFPPQDFEPEINIYLDTDVPVYVERILMRSIRSVLNPLYNCKLTTASNEDKIDLVLSTLDFNDRFSKTPQLFINAELSEKDAKYILAECRKIILEKEKDRK